MKRRLYVMVKEPHPGRVKTRLGRDIGMVASAWWFRHQVKHLLMQVANDPRWETVLCVSPDIEGSTSRVWPEGLARRPQGRGDLGDRMGRILRENAGGPAIIIGADIPNIRSSDIWAGFKTLGDHDAVFGPAPDGGYWLIGWKGRAKPVPSEIFKDVRWSSEWALDDTIATMKGAKIGFLRTLQDVDTLDDLKKL